MEITLEVVYLINGLILGALMTLSALDAIVYWREGIFDYVDDGCDEAMAGAIETLKKKVK